MIDVNDVCKVLRIGNIKFEMIDGEIKKLCNIRHVSNMRKNLISLRTIDGSNVNYEFSNGVLKVSK